MINRRKFLTLGGATAASLPLAYASPALARTENPLKDGGEGYSHLSGTRLEAIPAICGQCPSRCAVLGFVDGGQVVKIEGQPKSIRNLGRICAKGQAGAAKINDPDRIMTPLKRTGRRGEGKWKTISWDEALGDLAARLAALRDKGTPEKFVFNHGWISASARKLITEIFLPAYGTASIIDQSCQSQSARQTALELTWGGQSDNWDFDNTRFVLNFGSNVLEAHSNQVALARRLSLSKTDRGIKIVTFDVRLSNTAARSDQWIPIKPGTDLAVVLAMCNVVMTEQLYRGSGEDFLQYCRVSNNLEASTAEKIAALSTHLAAYTPDWAEKISGVRAAQITAIARRFAATKPACVISSRGAGAHYNGVETERAIQMLAAITGNIDNKGGRCQAVTPQWRFPSGPEITRRAGKMAFIDNTTASSALPLSGSGYPLLKRIKQSGDQPEIYMWYHHNPAYAYADTQATVDILKDETLLPFTVAVTPFYDESAALADLILPDATYLERFDVDDAVSPNQIAEYALTQPLTPPRDGIRDFKDVCIDLAARMGFPLGFKSSEKFIKKTCKLTKVVKKKARGFRGMKKRGVWHDKNAAPVFARYLDQIKSEALSADGVLLDEKTGVYWNWKRTGAGDEAGARAAGYTDTPDARKGYVGQRIGGVVYAGFKPGIFNKTGLFELYSPVLAARGLPALPSFVAIPQHADLKADDLILTTFKLNVQTLSNTGNSGWLDEVESDNPAWINPQTAVAGNISEGDSILIKSSIGEVRATAKLTPAIIPGTIAVPAHFGRQAGGRYAAGKPAPFAVEDAHHDKYMWWDAGGTHANQIIPDKTEPVSGQQCWMDTVVNVLKIQA